MLQVQNIHQYYGGSHILRNVSLQTHAGQVTVLLGRNGVGKTTLLKSIMGLLSASSGKIAFDEHDLIAQPTHLRSGLGIGYMPEDRRLIPDLTVEENILVPVWANKNPAPLSRLEYVYDLIPELKGFSKRRGQQLSGGQQKLVALGRALMIGTNLLLLDEPFEGVAPALAQRLAEVISQLKAEGMSVLFSESDLQYSEKLVQNIFVIDRGILSHKKSS